MKIIQFSDLHMTEASDLAAFKHKIDMLFNVIRNEVKPDEDIIFCCCGDITDAGDEKGYVIAGELFNYISEIFNKYKIYFEFVPGNHDLIDKNFVSYDAFTDKYISGAKYKFANESTWLREYEGLKIVLLNSSYQKTYKYGAADIQSLQDILKKCDHNTIVITHHTLMSRHEDDESSIRNSYGLIEALSKANVFALLHGHTHGYSEVTIGDNCKVIGVGPLFKTIKDVPNQFNLINIVANNIDEISNFSYRSDLGLFNKFTVFKLRNKGYFESNSVKDIYNKVVENTKAYGCIYNFNLHLETKADLFYIEIRSMFETQIPIAQQWQEKKCPNTLYYNHGQYFDKGDIDGLEYVITELNAKATSSRAILPLVNVEDVKGSGDGFFPSLDIIQFGFDNENKSNLHITIYLRALEVNHFLRINLSEIYIMALNLQSKIRSITDLTIDVISFRAQYKESFGCFRKADIDLIDIEDLMMHVSEFETINIIQLLRNKLELAETVIIETGVNNLCSSVSKYNSKHPNKYSKELIGSISELQRLYSTLKDLRNRTSIYAELKHIEDNITEQMKAVIGHFEEMEASRAESK